MSWKPTGTPNCLITLPSISTHIHLPSLRLNWVSSKRAGSPLNLSFGRCANIFTVSAANDPSLNPF